jgi:hypothetical protein
MRPVNAVEKSDVERLAAVVGGCAEVGRVN